jgi:hypothetical protein
LIGLLALEFERAAMFELVLGAVSGNILGFIDSGKSKCPKILAKEN